MEDNEYTSIKDILEWCEREGVRKESDLTRAEIVELARSALAEIEGERDRQIQAIQNLFQPSTIAADMAEEFARQQEANKHHEAAMDVLEGAIRGAYNDPAMTLEVKKITEVFLILLERRRPLFNYKLETIFRPVIEEAGNEAVAEATRHAAKAPRKKTGKDAALLMYEEWAAEPVKFKNQTQFTKAVKAAKHCDSRTTALDWLNQFRTTQPCEELEKILPIKK